MRAPTVAGRLFGGLKAALKREALTASRNAARSVVKQAAARVLAERQKRQGQRVDE